MRGKVRLARMAISVRMWTPAEKEKVRDLYYEGYSDKEIGAEIKRSEKAVGIERHRQGLKKSRQPGREFVIHDAIKDYYPRWYIKLLKEEWKQRASTYTN